MIKDLSIDSQLIDKIFKFASIKHILNNNQNNHDKIFDLFEEITRDLKNYELELRIEELESKFYDTNWWKTNVDRLRSHIAHRESEVIFSQ